MPTIPSLKIRSSPLVEVALSVVTENPIIDPLDISSFYKANLAKYPDLSRQLPVIGIENGEIFNIPPAIRDTDLGAAPRYWLISKDGHDLLQLQERFVSRNWRRQSSPLEPVYYPGYESIAASAFDDFRALIDNAGGADRAAQPIGAQLHYDNIIVMRKRNGDPWKLGEILKNWNTLDASRPNINWQLHWSEPLPPEGEAVRIGDTWQPHVPLLNTGMMAGGFVEPGKTETVPVLRVTMTVVGQSHSWEQARDFFGFAHGKVREKFISLFTDEIISEWDAA